MKNHGEVSSIPVEEKRIVGVRVAAAVGGIALLAVLAPIIWSTVSAGVGLMTLLVNVGIDIALFQGLGMLGQRLEDKLLAARKEEASLPPAPVPDTVHPVPAEPEVEAATADTPKEQTFDEEMFIDLSALQIPPAEKERS